MQGAARGRRRGVSNLFQFLQANDTKLIIVFEVFFQRSKSWCSALAKLSANSVS